MAASSLIGSVVADRYRVLELLGEGGMGCVYRVEHARMGRPFALKVLSPELAGDESLAERFRREAVVTSRLDHPNIVFLADFGWLPTGQPYLVMEYVPGESLRDRMESCATGLMPLLEVIDVLIQVARALDVAHRAGIVHRDLKPENLLLSRGPDGIEVVKVLDFGVAKLMDSGGEGELTKVGQVLGTPSYMSPEQGLSGEIDGRSDLYGLGVIAYELVAGRLPFEYDGMARMIMAHAQEVPAPPSRVRPVEETPIPLELDRLILDCLEKSRSRRPRTAGDVVVALADLAALIEAPAELEVTVAHGGREDEDEEDEVTVEVTRTLEGRTHARRFVSSSQVVTYETRATERRCGWPDVVQQGRHVAQLLRIHRLGGNALDEVIVQLDQAGVNTQAWEGEVDVARTRLGEIEQAMRQAEAELRHALVELTAERGRRGGRGADRQALSELDRRIAELERGLGEVYEQRARKEAEMSAALAQREAYLDQVRQHQIDLEIHLVNLLHRLRPRPAPAPLADGYDDLARILKAINP